MKSVVSRLLTKKGRTISIKFVFILSSLIGLPFTSLFGQTKKNIDLLLECVQQLGNGKYVANFGYNNPNSAEIAISDASSALVVKQNGKTKKNGLAKFKPGRNIYVMKTEFSDSDTIVWRVEMPDGTIREIQASKSSNQCSLLPYYAPPSNGRVESSVLSPELSALYDSYSETACAISNNIYHSIFSCNYITSLNAQSHKSIALKSLVHCPDNIMRINFVTSTSHRCNTSWTQ